MQLLKSEESVKSGQSGQRGLRHMIVFDQSEALEMLTHLKNKNCTGQDLHPAKAVFRHGPIYSYMILVVIFSSGKEYLVAIKQFEMLTSILSRFDNNSTHPTYFSYLKIFS